MPQKINFEKVHGKFMEWFLIHLMTKEAERRNIPTCDIKQVWPNIKPDQMEICFTIDGIEVPVVEFFEETFGINGSITNATVKEIFKDRLDDFNDKMHDLEKAVRNLSKKFDMAAKEESKKLGVDLTSDEDYW